MLWFNKGLALYKLGRYQEALHAYDEALIIDPDYVPATLNKGSALHKLGRYREAVNAYDEVLSRDPNRVTAWYNKGLALGELGRISQAIDACNEVLFIYSLAQESKNSLGCQKISESKRNPGFLRSGHPPSRFPSPVFPG